MGFWQKKYFILVFGYYGAEGNFALTVRTHNDDCENALGPRALGLNTYGSVLDASVYEIILSYQSITVYGCH